MFVGRRNIILENNGVQPTLDLNFALWAGKTAIDPRVSFTRASVANYFDSTGTLQSVSANIPRLDFNPSTLAFRGLLIEEARTNSIRNNTMQGAVASVPITAQTITALTNVTTTATLATTPTAHGLSTGNIITVSGATPAAYNGTFSVTVLTGSTLTYTMASNPGGSASPVGSYTAQTRGALPTNWSVSGLSGNFTAFIVVAVGVENGIAYADINYVTAGAVGGVDTTIESSVVASNSQIWTGSFYDKLSAGSNTNVTHHLRVLETGGTGALSDVTFVPTAAGLATQRVANSYTNTQVATNNEIIRYQWSTSGAANWTIRIGLPQLELGAFPTSVISTSGTAQTRQADVASISTGAFPFNAQQGTLLVSATPSVLATGGNLEIASLGADSSNVITLRFPVGSSALNAISFVSGASKGSTTSSNGAVANSLFKGGFSYSAPLLQVALSGQSNSIVLTGLPSMPQLGIGGASSFGRGGACNCWLSRIRYFPFAMNAQQLRAVTQ